MHATLEQGKTILHRLQAAGHEAFFVGGAVRDYLLNIPIHDIDITTSAPVDVVSTLFDKTILTGAKYGTVTVLIDKVAYEVTTYRADVGYSDFRRPDAVLFTRRLDEDLKRRDFTMNQLVMDHTLNVIDHYGGLEDLKKRCIRAIGQPNARFTEDALRMLRAFRFVAKLGFTIEANTLEAIAHSASLMGEIAIERIQDELTKLFNERHAKQALKSMLDCGFTRTFFGLEVGLKALAEANISFDDTLAFIMLYRHHDALGDIFKFSSRRLKAMANISHLAAMTETTPFQRTTVFREGLKNCLMANRLNQMLGFADQTEFLHALYEALPLHDARELVYRGEDILKHLHPLPKRLVGQILQQLLDAVIEGRLPNEYQALNTYAQSLKNQLGKE